MAKAKAEALELIKKLPERRNRDRLLCGEQSVNGWIDDMHVVQKAGRIGSNTTQTQWAAGGAFHS